MYVYLLLKNHFFRTKYFILLFVALPSFINGHLCWQQSAFSLSFFTERHVNHYRKPMHTCLGWRGSADLNQWSRNSAATFISEINNGGKVQLHAPRILLKIPTDLCKWTRLTWNGIEHRYIERENKQIKTIPV